MKIEIENLKALIHGKELTIYQKALAMNEWSKLQLYVTDLEKLNQAEVIKSVCEISEPIKDCDIFKDRGCTCDNCEYK